MLNETETCITTVFMDRGLRTMANFMKGSVFLSISAESQYTYFSVTVLLKRRSKCLS